MKQINKVFGIGMSKTGTTTLGECLKILGFGPHVGFEPGLKKWIERGGRPERVLRFAERFRSFEDSPWYHLYRELDERFPGSKFVLTVRKDSITHAKSSWAHGARRGTRLGEMTEEYKRQKIAIYEKHNAEVIEYFRDRPDDLLVLCWENGDGWKELSSFLGVPAPDLPIPHCNQGKRRSFAPSFVAESRPYAAVVRSVYAFTRTSVGRMLVRSVGSREAAGRNPGR